MPTIKVKGMSCTHCAASVTRALTAITGIEEVTVNLKNGEVEYTESKPVEPAAIREAVTRAGFEAQ